MWIISHAAANLTNFLDAYVSKLAPACFGTILQESKQSYINLFPGHIFVDAIVELSTTNDLLWTADHQTMTYYSYRTKMMKTYVWNAGNMYVLFH